jgi:hypothetical protein
LRRPVAPPLALALAAAACLPASRPPPGRAAFFVSAGPEAEAGSAFATADGWSVAFASALFGGASTSFRDEKGDGCTEYYSRSVNVLYDLVPPGPKPVAYAAAEGTCLQALFIEAMPAYSALGPGVDAGAQERLLEAANEAPAGAARPFAAMLVRGEAARGQERKTFAWPLFFDRYAAACATDTGVFPTEVNSEAEFDVTIEFRLERLFGDRLDPAAALRFEPFAAADADADGAVTRAELARVPLAGLAAAGDGYRDAPSVRGAPLVRPAPRGRAPTLADFLDAQAMLLPSQRGQSYCAP